MIDVWRSRYARRGEPLDGKGNVFWRQAASYGDFEEFILRGTEELPRLRRPQIRYLRARGAKPTSSRGPRTSPTTSPTR